MGEVLANAVAFFEDFIERRRDHGRLRVVLKFRPYPVHQVDRAGKDTASRRKAGGSIRRDRLLDRHQRAGEDISDRRRGAETGGLECHVADTLPCATLRGAAGRAAGDRDPRSGIDPKGAMRGFDQDAFGMRPEKIPPHRPVRWPRPDIDGVRDQLLSVGAFGLQPQ
jgi:hypothetical protein